MAEPESIIRSETEILLSKYGNIGRSFQELEYRLARKITTSGLAIEGNSIKDLLKLTFGSLIKKSFENKIIDSKFKLFLEHLLEKRNYITHYIWKEIMLESCSMKILLEKNQFLMETQAQVDDAINSLSCGPVEFPPGVLEICGSEPMREIWADIEYRDFIKDYAKEKSIWDRKTNSD